VPVQLYAVANYGIGANMDGGKSLAAMTGLPVTRDNHVTLKHLQIGETDGRTQNLTVE
jgi:hypothetical protein